MLCRKNLTSILFSLKYFTRHASKKVGTGPSIISKPPTNYFITNILGINEKRCAKILKKNPELFNVSRKDLINSVEYLKSIKYTADDIELKPMILYVNSITLENRYEILKESGFTDIPLPILFKYVTVMNKEVSFLKSHSILSSDTDVQYNLEQVFTSDMKIKLNEKINENLLIKTFREKILNEYLKNKLNFTETQLQNQWKVYGRLRNKTYKSIIKMINLLINELNFSSEKIIKNGYLLYGDPENLKKIISDESLIVGQNFKEILYKRPKVIMSTYESIAKTIENIKKFGIHDNAILKCLEILTLGPETVLERLNEIKNNDELQALLSNPRILRLVHYQNKAVQRLEYLNTMKVKCASLHILSCDSDAFVKFAREGTDRNKGKDLVGYLANTFSKTENEIRIELSKQPNWCHVPISQVKDCLQFLTNNLFSLSDIFENVHLLLYPKYKIDEKLSILRTDEFYKESQLDVTYAYIPYNNILTLCLYLIEFEFHFTGDGIWTDQHTHNVENFNNFIPDFLDNNKKIYKYGGKPAEKATLKSEAVV